MKRPSEALWEEVFENLDKLRDNQKFNFENFDKYIVWVTGFSIGGISIIVTNLTKFQSFSHTALKTVLILLAVSIISGLIYRWAYFRYQTVYQNIEFYLHGAFSNKDIMNIHADDVSEITDLNEIILKIRVDFGEDLLYILEQRKGNENPEADSILLSSLKERHKRLAEYAKKDYQIGMEHINDTLKKAFGYSDKQISKFYSANNSKQIKSWHRVASVFFLLSCLTFISVIIMLVVKY